MRPHPLLGKLKRLRLGGMVHTLEQRAQEAQEQSLSPVEFLALLLDDELQRREQTRLQRRILEAKLDVSKTQAQFDFTAAARLSKTRIRDLLSCRYVDKADNVLFVGPTGTGKSHLAQALAHEAIKRGYQALYRPLHRLLERLHASRADGTFPRVYRHLVRVDVLVLDDFGLVPLSARAAQDLYEIIRDRYEQRSLIVTSNRSSAEWLEVFGDPLLGSAALDRLTHHAHIIEMTHDSYRQRQRRLSSQAVLFSSQEVNTDQPSNLQGGDI